MQCRFWLHGTRSCNQGIWHSRPADIVSDHARSGWACQFGSVYSCQGHVVVRMMCLCCTHQLSALQAHPFEPVDVMHWRQMGRSECAGWIPNLQTNPMLLSVCGLQLCNQLLQLWAQLAVLPLVKFDLGTAWTMRTGRVQLPQNLQALRSGPMPIFSWSCGHYTTFSYHILSDQPLCVARPRVGLQGSGLCSLQVDRSRKLSFDNVVQQPCLPATVDRCTAMRSCKLVHQLLLLLLLQPQPWQLLPLQCSLR